MGIGNKVQNFITARKIHPSSYSSPQFAARPRVAEIAILDEMLPIIRPYKFLKRNWTCMQNFVILSAANKSDRFQFNVAIGGISASLTQSISAVGSWQITIP